jgi:hypothetical protein
MFERYGGFAKISKIVSDFYGRVLDSPIMGPYFEESDMKRLIDHQTKFIASIMGGPASHPQEWLGRIGINSGPIIGSIVGIQKYVYDIFGPGVNLAARMEGLAGPMSIALCEDTHELIKDDFRFSAQGEIEVKGFGNKQLYFLEGEHA